jgi:integrase
MNISLWELVHEAYLHDALRVEKGLLAKTTFKGIKTRFRNLEQYLVLTSQKEILAKDVNVVFIDKFRKWLEVEKMAGNAHVSKHVAHIKLVLNEAELYERIPINKISKYVCRRKNKFLNNHIELFQLDKIQSTSFRPALKRVADLFAFACYTGLAFAELERFDPKKHIQIIDAKEWIVMDRKKTGDCFYVPLFEGAKRIINDLGTLPKISNQRYNDHLKEVALLCGIHSPLTSHSARKTFAILATERYKFSLESISFMLGHSDIKTTQSHYARVRLNTVKNELLKMTA